MESIARRIGDEHYQSKMFEHEAWIFVEFLFPDFVSARFRATALMTATHKAKCYAEHDMLGHASWADSSHDCGRQQASLISFGDLIS